MLKIYIVFLIIYALSAFQPLAALPLDADSENIDSDVAVTAVCTSTCTSIPTFVVSGTLATPAPNAITKFVGGPLVTVGMPSIPQPPVPTQTSTIDPNAIGNFGSCSTPSIDFGPGFDNRRETSYQPTDKTSFNHTSSDNIDIITKFICDELKNTCGADENASESCDKAQAAADSGKVGTGEQADLFNGVFGIVTNFAAIPQIDNQGHTVSLTSPPSTIPLSSTSTASSTNSATTASATTSASTAGVSGNSASESNSSSNVSFGSCSTPQIEFGTGFDNRTETSFRPVDTKSFNHGSTQTIDDTAKFICKQLGNSACSANQAAIDLCNEAQAKADTGPSKTGTQADLFNAVFGIQTNFAAIDPVDDQGRDTDDGASTASSKSTELAVSNNLQTFTGNLGNIPAPAVTSIANGKFQVEGNDVINTEEGALSRSCDVQQNLCADAANKSGNKGDFTVAACTKQQNQCKALVKA